MSRTHKDAPYWVRLNRESISTDHDHLHLGETYYKTVSVLDKNDNPVYDITDWGYSAEELFFASKSIFSNEYRVLHPWRYYRGDEYEQFNSIPARAIREARNEYSAGRKDTFIVCGQYLKERTKRVPYLTVADHCTGGEPLQSKDWLYYHSEMPCTPNQPDSWSFYKTQTYGMAKAKAHIRSEINGHIRITERDRLKQVARDWNSGYEVEDYDEDVNFTKSQPNPWNWYLY